MYSFTATPIGSKPSGQTTLIGNIQCEGYESTIDDCTISTSTSICPTNSINTISCRPWPLQNGELFTRLAYYFNSNIIQLPIRKTCILITIFYLLDSQNQGGNCSSQYGFCGWKPVGKTTWVWYNADNQPFYPFSGLPIRCKSI